MNDPSAAPRRSRRRAIYVVAVLVILNIGAVVAAFHFYGRGPWLGTDDTLAAATVEASEQEVKHLCSYCHKFPPPSVLSKKEWEGQITEVYGFIKAANLKAKFEIPKPRQVLQYYVKRAPLQLHFEPTEPASDSPPVRFEPSDYLLPHQNEPMVSNVNLVHLFDKKKLDVLACDMREGWVTAFKPYSPNDAVTIGRAKHPAHAEAVDLDGDGILDVLVADLGSMFPTNEKTGRVLWFKGRGDGTFEEPQTLLDGVGRVADVQAADFQGRGKKDLVVAAFGWRETGEVIYLENQTEDWRKPKFAPHVLDDRHGAIHVPIADLNGDGKPDFVALISQEHEIIVAFINEGNGKFRKEVIFEGPHPSYGSSGIQLVDFNNDGKIDVLYTNGDVMDSGAKPWHSVQWLENRGTFPFVHHHLATLYGVHRAVAVDVDGHGLLDVIATTTLPTGTELKLREHLSISARGSALEPLESIVLLRQTAPGQFQRYALERGNAHHITCAAGDLDGDGRMHLVTGNFFFLGEGKSSSPSITVWKNQSPTKMPAP